MVRLALVVSAVTALTLGGIAAAAGSADVFTYRSLLTAGAEVPRVTAPSGAGGLFTAKVTTDGTSYAIS